MEVTVLNITNNNDEPDFSVWEDTKSAAKQACALIVETIDNEWDLNESWVLNDAKKINALIQGGDYLEAVNYWNDCDVVTDSCYSNYYWIESRAINNLSDVQADLKIFNLEPEDTDSCTAVSVQSVSTNGATCRTCHTLNEYAMADKSDGTYVCRGCKGMSQIFGA